ARVTLPQDGGLVPERGADVAIEAVDAGVQLSAREPAGVRGSPGEHFLPSLEPDDVAGARGPERLGIPVGLPVEGSVPRVGRTPERSGGTEDALLLEEDVDAGLDPGIGRPAR